MGDFLSNLSNVPQYAADWWNGKRSINPVSWAWNSLPGNVKDTYTSGARALVDMSTPASVRDYTTSAQDTARSAMQGDGWGAATGGLGMVNAALGAIPIAGMGVRAAQKVGMGLADEGRNFIRAYHGSPHSFDKFDLSKIGTGEGAQAYGHGLYFAEEPKIAETYRAKVSAMQGLPGATVGGNPINWDDPIQAAAFEVARHNGDRAAAADFYERTFKSSNVPSIIRSGAELPEVKMPGSMYEVAIHADPAKFLDWDKPLTEQSPFVSAAIEKILRGKEGADDMIWRASPGGREINLSAMSPDQRRITEETLKVGGLGTIQPRWQHELNDAGPMTIAGRWSGEAAKWGDKPDPVAASAALRDAGVPGVRYLDAGSRGASDGSRNYVVFDDNIIEILRKYGLLPAAGAAGFYGATAGDPQPQGAY